MTVQSASGHWQLWFRMDIPLLFIQPDAFRRVYLLVSCNFAMHIRIAGRNPP